MGEVLLPYSLPGELVEFERHIYRNQKNTILTEIIEFSPRRINAPCKYFGTCGGCALQHLSESDYLEFKLSKITRYFPLLGISSDILKPLISIGVGKRRRTRLSAIKKRGSLFLGFRRYHSNQVINIDSCPLLTPDLSKLIVPLKEYLFEMMIENQKIELCITEADNGIDLMLENAEISLTIDHSKFCLEHNIIRLQNGKEILYIQQTPYILFDEVPVEIEANGFLQSSKEADERLKEQIFAILSKYFLMKPSYQAGIDFFCGRGAYSIPLSNYFKIAAFDSDQRAIDDLTKSVYDYSLRIVPKCRDLFINPLIGKELRGYDFAIINPPRAGAEAQINEIASSAIIKFIIYVSCNPESFFADAKILLSAGYELLEITPIDQFHWNAHLEIVAVFNKV
jgi:23S rRNA (uracil1939-C5)-methyltransferase